MTAVGREGRPWAAVLGRPIAHSLSPALHSAAYAVLEEDLDYRSRDVGPEEFPEVVEAARADTSWRGFSVTMPLKSEALAAADRVTDLARAVGTANTLVPDPVLGHGGTAGSRPLLAHNTDVAGIREALAATGSVPRTGPRAAILGGGGTSTAAAAALRQLGARSCTAYVRNEVRAARLIEAARRLDLELDFRGLADFGAEAGEHDLVVSTLPPRAADPLAADLLDGDADLRSTTVLDVAYDPWPSALADAVVARGGTVVPGTDMLVHQAVDQIKLFTGRALDALLPYQDDVLAVLAATVPPPRG